MKSLLPLCLLLAACSQSTGMGNEAAINDTYEAMTPGTRPVRIGEGGASFAACANVGRVVNVGSNEQPYLALRAAPFQEADELLRLSNAARLLVCTRSIDQKWQGVVVPPADAPDADCGVASPVASARDYAGPCRSGWVASAFVRMIAN
jgi:hypothetical protein